MPSHALKYTNLFEDYSPGKLRMLFKRHPRMQITTHCAAFFICILFRLDFYSIYIFGSSKLFKLLLRRVEVAISRGPLLQRHSTPLLGPANITHSCLHHILKHGPFSVTLPEQWPLALIYDHPPLQLSTYHLSEPVGRK